MVSVVERVSRITEKGQTTVPKAVREALGVDSGDRIVFRIDEAGVSLRPAATESDDPALESFLAFLADDMRRRPQAIMPVSTGVASRMVRLTRGKAVDPDEEIEGNVAI